MIFQYGTAEGDLILWHVFNNGVTLFWTDILQFDYNDIMKCPQCGPNPSSLVMDGVAIGLNSDKLREETNLFFRI